MDEPVAIKTSIKTSSFHGSSPPGFSGGRLNWAILDSQSSMGQKSTFQIDRRNNQGFS
jgi:hypothetical protein